MKKILFFIACATFLCCFNLASFSQCSQYAAGPYSDQGALGDASCDNGGSVVAAYAAWDNEVYFSQVVAGGEYTIEFVGCDQTAWGGEVTITVIQGGAVGTQFDEAVSPLPGAVLGSVTGSCSVSFTAAETGVVYFTTTSNCGGTVQQIDNGVATLTTNSVDCSVAGECGNGICEELESFLDCPGDCPCESSIAFIDWPALTTNENPSAYCAVDLTDSGIGFDGGANLDPPAFFIPFVVNSDGELIANEYTNGVISADNGTLYNSTSPPTPDDGGVATSFIYFLTVTDADIAAGSVTISFDNGVGCSVDYVINFADAFPGGLDAATSCPAGDEPPVVCAAGDIDPALAGIDNIVNICYGEGEAVSLSTDGNEDLSITCETAFSYYWAVFSDEDEDEDGFLDLVNLFEIGTDPAEYNTAFNADPLFQDGEGNLYAADTFLISGAAICSNTAGDGFAEVCLTTQSIIVVVSNCGTDPECGNGVCEEGEDSDNCPGDCPPVVAGECSQFAAGPYSDQGALDISSCENGGSVVAAYAAWENEIYWSTVAAGADYTIEFDGCSQDAWGGEVTITVIQGGDVGTQFDEAVSPLPGAIIASATGGCSVDFTAPATGVVYFTITANCGGAVQQIDNGVATLTTTSDIDPADCVDVVTPEPTCVAGDVDPDLAGLDNLVTVCSGTMATITLSTDGNEDLSIECETEFSYYWAVFSDEDEDGDGFLDLVNLFNIGTDPAEYNGGFNADALFADGDGNLYAADTFIISGAAGCPNTAGDGFAEVCLTTGSILVEVLAADDPACEADPILGCTDEAACNYDADATEDDDSCLYLDCAGDCGGDAVAGTACGENGTYNADCECVEEAILGCTDEIACNYNAEATEDDGSCATEDCLGECGGAAVAGTACGENGTYNDACQCVEPVSGCTDETACNYNAEATEDDGSCATEDCNGDCGGDAVEGSVCEDTGVLNADCECVFDAVPGCTNPEAGNYNEAATVDNGSCILGGSIDEPAESEVTCNGDEIALPANSADAPNTEYLVLDQGDLILVDTPNMIFEPRIVGVIAGDAADFDPTDYGFEAGEDFCLTTVSYDIEIVQLIIDAINPSDPANTCCGVLTGAIGADVCGSLCDMGGICSGEDVTGFQQVIDLFGIFGAEPTVTGISDAIASLNQTVEDNMALLPIVCPGLVEGFPVYVAFSSNDACYTCAEEATPVEGCTDETACNYDETATIDDGSCATLDCAGECGGDAIAGTACGTNGQYNDDCECIEDAILGCTDETACNYNADATEDDGSCATLDCAGECGGDAIAGTACGENGTYNDACECIEAILGCTDETACNYNADATEDDGSCATLDCAGECGGDAIAGTACGENGTYNADCECIEAAVFGCTNVDACNYDETATEDDGSCILPGDTCDDEDDTTINDLIDADCGCQGTAIVEGCTDETACNYNADANTDDGSCATEDCLGECGGAAVAGTACGTNGTYNTDCECIEDAIPGCTNADACNYDETANADDGSCILPGDACDDGDDATINDMINADCGCQGTLAVEGCTDETACNYNAEANVDDGSCATLDCAGECGGDAIAGTACGTNGQYNADCECIEAAIFGCTDETACNYNADATEDDGSCATLDCAGECGGDAIAGTACGTNGTYNTDCECVEGAIFGCTDADACNYNAEATEDDGSCAELDCNGDCGGDVLPGTACGDNGVLTDDCECEETPILGCTDETACNYNADATVDDGSCAELDCDGECGGSVLPGADCGENGTINDDCECIDETDVTPETGDIDGTVTVGGEDAEGIEVVLLDAEGVEVASTTTDDDGDYSFDDVEEGDYTIEVTGPDGTIESKNISVEADGSIDGDADFELDAVTPEDCDDLNPVQVSLDISCDENSGIYTLTASFSGGLPEYAMENGGDPDDFFYTVTGDISGSFDITDNISIELTDNAEYTVTAVDALGCSDSVSDTPPSCTKTAVEFMGLNGRIETTGNYLYWATASEENNDYFEVQRAFDGATFETIGKVESVGNSNVVSSYNFTDTESPAGVSFYRVAIVDVDGKVDYSNVITLEREGEQFGITHIAPVPTSDQITVSFNTSINSTAVVSVVDVTGKVIETIDVTTVEGLNQLTLKVSQYSAGVYFLNITDGVNSSVDRFIVE